MSQDQAGQSSRMRSPDLEVHMLSARTTMATKASLVAAIAEVGVIRQ